MMSSRTPLACVAFMLIADQHILVEKRSAAKRLLPGIMAIPGGHVEAGETLEAALVRELHEELNITPLGFTHLCDRLHQAEEYRRIHYFVVERWTGEMVMQEAAALHWLPLDNVSALNLEVDMTAVAQYRAQASPSNRTNAEF